MQVDFLIVGQGISGSWLSYYLEKESCSYLVIDNNDQYAASRLAAGLINPVTGRRHVEVWMADEILPFAWNAYIELGKELGTTVISSKTIIDQFPTPQMRLSFQQRADEKGAYVSMNESKGDLRHLFNYELGYGEIQPAYLVQLEKILPAWRKKLLESDLLLSEEFDFAQLKTSKESVRYKEITAQKIFFCDGNNSVYNPYFKTLPFAPNKGEIFIVEIPDLPRESIYKCGMMLAPLSEAGLWWMGSNYAWEFDDPYPTTAFREKTELLLNRWLKIPFTIQKHLAGIRPATLERRPFVGFHPSHPQIGILNGMGTKGCSLAPFFAKQLVENVLHNAPISPEGDVKRFSRILSR